MREIFLVFLTSMTPVFELRFGIPLGIVKYSINPYVVVCSAVLGNCLIIMPILLFFQKLLHYLEKWPFLGRFVTAWFERVHLKAEKINKYGFWGLALFVAVPFPGSGVWSGGLAASILDMDRYKALCACVLGVLIAAFLVTLGTLGVIHLF